MHTGVYRANLKWPRLVAVTPFTPRPLSSFRTMVTTTDSHQSLMIDHLFVHLARNFARSHLVILPIVI